MSKSKLQSSALLIALTLGVIVSGLVIGLSVAMSQFSKMSAQERDGKLAYRAAASGIDDALLRYQYARANNKLQSLYTTIPEIFLQPQSNESARMSYQISFQSSSVDTGRPGVNGFDFIGNIFNPSWLTDPVNNARKAGIDQVIDIDLTTDIETLNNIKVYFTAPYRDSSTGPISLSANYFNAMNLRIVDISLSRSAEEQLVWEQTNSAPSSSMMEVNSSDLLRCKGAGSSCHLRIRSQAVKVKMLPNGAAASRLQGVIDPAQRYAFYAIQTDLPEVEKTNTESPGTVILTSVGTAGQAKRKIEAKIDSSSGSYIGLFDYGIYCGKECSGL